MEHRKRAELEVVHGLYQLAEIRNMSLHQITLHLCATLKFIDYNVAMTFILIIIIIII